MAKSRRNFLEYITEEHRNFMLRVFGTDDIYEIDRRDNETINYSEDRIMPYICGDYGDKDSELAEDIIDFLYMVALPQVTDRHRKFMIRLFGTNNVEEVQRVDEKSGWNYVGNKIEPYLSGDDVEIKELADDIWMFVHAPYRVEI